MLKDNDGLSKPYPATITAVRTLFFIKLPKIPRAKSNLRSESELGVDTRNSWRDCHPSGEDLVSAYLEVRKSIFRVRTMVD